jgi:hypothetical protein
VAILNLINQSHTLIELVIITTLSPLCSTLDKGEGTSSQVQYEYGTVGLAK